MLLPRLAAVVAGIAAGALTKRWQQESAAATPGVMRSLDKLSRDMQMQAASHERRLKQLEARVADHETKLKDMPSTAQFVAAMEDLLAGAMGGLDRCLATQAQSIETLQMTVAETDELLERVLESLDTLRDPAGT